MSQNGEVSKKSIQNAFKRYADFAFDIIYCFVFAIPLLCKEILKSFFPKQQNVRGKLALVTGAGGGLGRSISLKLADLGCNVAVVDINETTAEAVAAELRLKGVQAKSFLVDISKQDAIRKLRDDVTNDMGPVDILINNAGMIPDMNTEITPGFLETMVKVNLLGTILMTRCFIKQMKEGQGGHVVAISSMSGLHPSPFAVGYSATKSGLNAFMTALGERLRLEKLDGKIKTTCICPYYITTRKDIVDFLNPDIRFPPLNIDDATNKVIDAIIKQETFVTIPAYYKFGCQLYNVLPLTVQQLVRDRVLKEYDFKSSK